jgi:hypothetical protein
MYEKKIVQKILGFITPYLVTRLNDSTYVGLLSKTLLALISLIVFLK